MSLPMIIEISTEEDVIHHMNLLQQQQQQQQQQLQLNEVATSSSSTSSIKLLLCINQNHDPNPPIRNDYKWDEFCSTVVDVLPSITELSIFGRFPIQLLVYMLQYTNCNISKLYVDFQNSWRSSADATDDWIIDDETTAVVADAIARYGKEITSVALGFCGNNSFAIQLARVFDNNCPKLKDIKLQLKWGRTWPFDSKLCNHILNLRNLTCLGLQGCNDPFLKMLFQSLKDLDDDRHRLKSLHVMDYTIGGFDGGNRIGGSFADLVSLVALTKSITDLKICVDNDDHTLITVTLLSPLWTVLKDNNRTVKRLWLRWPFSTVELDDNGGVDIHGPRAASMLEENTTIELLSFPEYGLPFEAREQRNRLLLLNRAGRGNANMNESSWIKALDICRKDLNCLYYFVKKYPCYIKKTDL